MPVKLPPVDPAPAARLQDAAHLLQALETLRDELGGVADDIIRALREAGVTTSGQSQSH
jgi:hypothetical protein